MKRGVLIVGATLVVLLAVSVFFGVYTPLPEETARTNLIGMWRSIEDAKFTREFKSDGSVVDAYEGSAVESSGHWVLFTKDLPPEGYTGPLDDGIYLAIGMPEDEALYFKITKIESQALELVYLNRGGVLSFEKI